LIPKDLEKKREDQEAAPPKSAPYTIRSTWGGKFQRQAT